MTATRQFSYNEEDEDLMPLQAFLSHAALEAGEGQADTWQDAVQLMTCTRRKGWSSRRCSSSASKKGCSRARWPLMKAAAWRRSVAWPTSA
ncbi:DNA-dependent helicase II [Klebsiella pneumoniae]|uniref:DNA-dependent helicase II n=1 Tax=Klebsiella pneumoniae TaxID=573 RepID=A0A2X3EY44_KLEPN|nr:DNA-dependent helicase II [Klebsiella pneumoniae]